MRGHVPTGLDEDGSGKPHFPRYCGFCGNLPQFLPQARVGQNPFDSKVNIYSDTNKYSDCPRLGHDELLSNSLPLAHSDAVF